jgi:hypothetical protein
MIVKIVIVLALVVFTAGLLYSCFTIAKWIAEGVDEFRRK